MRRMRGFDELRQQRRMSGMAQQHGWGRCAEEIGKVFSNEASGAVDPGVHAAGTGREGRTARSPCAHANICYHDHAPVGGVGGRATWRSSRQGVPTGPAVSPSRSWQDGTRVGTGPRAPRSRTRRPRCLSERSAALPAIYSLGPAARSLQDRHEPSECGSAGLGTSDPSLRWSAGEWPAG